MLCVPLERVEHNLKYFYLFIYYIVGDHVLFTRATFPDASIPANGTHHLALDS